MLNEEAAEVSIAQASICASENDVGVAGGSGSGSGHRVPSHGAGDDAEVESATSVKTGDDSIAGSGSGLAPLAHDDLQGVVRLLSGCSTSTAASAAVGGLALRGSGGGSGGGSGVVLAGAVGRTSGSGEVALAIAFDRWGRLVMAVAVGVKVDRIVSRTGSAGGSGGGSGGSGVASARPLVWSGGVAARSSTGPGTSRSREASRSRERGSTSGGSGGSGIEDCWVSKSALSEEAARVVSPVIDGSGHAIGSGSGIPEIVARCVDFCSHRKGGSGSGAIEVGMSAAPGGSDLFGGHSGGSDPEGIERVEGSSSGSAGLGGVIAVLRAQAENVFDISRLTVRHAEGVAVVVVLYEIKSAVAVVVVMVVVVVMMLMVAMVVVVVEVGVEEEE